LRYDQYLYLFSEPPGYYGPAGFCIKATDPIGFWDSVSVNLMIENDIITPITTDEKDIPLIPVLFQNFPNPFNPSTLIRYGISQPGYISLILYSILGERITTLYEDWSGVGYYQIELDCSDLAGGLYFVNMRIDGYQKTIKIFLMK
jgi:hypothetical protein